ncbi:MAG: hypothetical protein ABIG93_04865 [archaeon]|nr:hypothetical protein [Nanoarchaeota archaeon]
MALGSRVRALLATGIVSYSLLATGCGHWVYVRTETDPSSGIDYSVWRNEDDNTCDVVEPFDDLSCLIDYPLIDPSCREGFAKDLVNPEFVEKLICKCEGRPYFPKDRGFHPKITRR